MKLELKKFGSLLSSRQTGREALLAIRPVLRKMKPDETLEIDFDGVSVFTPSWADEFLTPLEEEYGKRITLQNAEKNSSVRAVLEFLKEIKETRS